MQKRYFIQLKDLEGEWRFIANCSRQGDHFLYEERKLYFTEEKADELLAVWSKENPSRRFQKIRATS
ncbi:hypothetical protein [Spirosoma harenae]